MKKSPANAAARTASTAPKRASRLPFTLALVVSLALHATLLSITFAGRTPPPPVKDRGLEIVLVNASHEHAPDKAEVLAQANLDGGGNTDDKNARPSSPLPPQERRTDGDAAVDMRRATQTTPPEKPKKAEQTAPTEDSRKIVKRNPAGPVQPDKPAPSPPESSPRNVTGHELMDSLAAIAKLEAQIDRRLDEYAKRPRKTQIGTRAREYRFAQYAENWRRKVERIGTLNYPDAARGRIYGNLVLTVAIRADGSIESIDIDRSSGHKVLDDAAVNIVRMAGPYAPFPPNVRADTDIIEITRTWNFTRSEQLTTH